MNKYNIYCTKRQTYKAFELGAPLIKCDTRDKHMIYSGHMCYPRTQADYPYAIPTAEQMIGWLKEQNIAIDLHTYFNVNSGKINNYEYTVTDSTRVFNGSKIFYKEAVLAAIDAALDYLLSK